MKKSYFAAFFLLIVNILHAQQNVNPNGYNVFTYPNGNKASEGNLKDGKPEGVWKTFYVDGILKSVGNRKNFELDSIWLFFNGKADTTFSIYYQNGKKNGYYLTYSEKTDSTANRMISKELYVDDIKQGLSYYYYPEGQLWKTVFYKEGKKHGESKEYSKDGFLVTIYKYHYDNPTDIERINRRDLKGQKQGIWKEYHANGLIKSEVNYLDGLYNGYFKEFDVRGRQIKAERYDKGNLIPQNIPDEDKVVMKEQFSVDGKVKSAGSYKNGVPVGVHKTYKQDTKVIEAIVFSNDGKQMAKGMVDSTGNRNGEWEFFFESGVPKASGEYKMNYREGNWKFAYPSGKLEQTGIYVKNKPNGEWKWFYESGKILRTEEFKNGLANGMMIEYAEDSSIIAKGKNVDGEKNGEWFYNINGEIQKGKYLAGKKEGLWKYYYTNGKIQYECKYSQGLENGNFRKFFDNKQMKEEGEYIMGKKEGNWKYYTSDGYLYLTLTFQDDKEIRIDGKKIGL